MMSDPTSCYDLFGNDQFVFISIYIIYIQLFRYLFDHISSNLSLSIGFVHHITFIAFYSIYYQLIRFNSIYFISLITVIFTRTCWYGFVSIIYYPFGIFLSINKCWICIHFYFVFLMNQRRVKQFGKFQINCIYSSDWLPIFCSYWLYKYLNFISISTLWIRIHSNFFIIFLHFHYIIIIVSFIFIFTWMDI